MGEVLPSVLPSLTCKGEEGFTDLSRLLKPNHLGSGQCYLPDKELRYLRTVIVTAAVYRSFGCELHPYGLTLFLNLPAPGRRQSLYILLRVGRDLCF